MAPYGASATAGAGWLEDPGRGGGRAAARRHFARSTFPPQGKWRRRQKEKGAANGGGGHRRANGEPTGTLGGSDPAHGGEVRGYAGSQSSCFRQLPATPFELRAPPYGEETIQCPEHEESVLSVGLKKQALVAVLFWERTCHGSAGCGCCPPCFCRFSHDSVAAAPASGGLTSSHCGGRGRQNPERLS